MLCSTLMRAVEGPSNTPTQLPGIARLGGQSFDALVWPNGGPAHELQLSGPSTAGLVCGGSRPS
ncbi:hypothetical protein HBB16_09565 [Pseudonocardia sp. MCCB 268]|nr:hypothetical protein [Pseudonocardia cytotoxica]